MPRIAYTTKRFRQDALEVIATANEILHDFAAQGYEVTLRQLYYQFVARDLIPNSDQSYKRLGNIVSDARMAGLIDWHRRPHRPHDGAGRGVRTAAEPGEAHRCASARLHRALRPVVVGT